MLPHSPHKSNTPGCAPRIIRHNPASDITQAEARIFQASSAFVSACQEATVAMHALTAKLRALEQGAQVPSKPKVKKKV